MVTSATIDPHDIPSSSAADAALGCFRNVPPSPWLDHLLRYLSTWSGTDKALQLAQYSSKVVVGLLRLSVLVRLHKNSQHLSPDSAAIALVAPLTKLSALCSRTRCLSRMWTTLSTFQWMVSLERTEPRSNFHLFIERLQGWSMLFYGPSEAAAFLGGHGILPLSARTQSKLWIYSSRAWAAYVGLQLVKTAQNVRVLSADSKARASELRSTAEKPLAEFRQPKSELAQRKDDALTELIINMGWLPLTIHWSIERGFLPDIAVGLLGTMACCAGIRRGWRATA